MSDQNMNNLMREIGNPGKFQVLIFILISVNFMIMLPTHLAMVFFAAKTTHHCKVGSGQNISDVIPTIVRDNMKQWDSCSMFKNGSKTETMSCNNGWTYYMEERERTIISEFDLVCDDGYKADLATTIYFCGVTLGGILFGYLADKFGRKTVIAITLLATFVIDITIFSFRTYISFVVLRFFLGLVIQGLQSSSVVLSMELFSTKYRGCIGILCGVFGNSGALVFGFLVYLIKDWRYVQLALSIVAFLQLFSLWFIPESIRWHVLHGHFEKAEATVKKIVKVNKLQYPEELVELVKQDSKKKLACPHTKRKVGVLDLYRSSSLRPVTIIMNIIWFTISIAFYGLAFNISFLFGNKYLNFCVSQAFDVICILLLLWAVSRFGRRKPLLFTIVFAAIPIIICAIIVSLSTDSTDLNITRTVAALVGKAFSTCAINVMILYTAEVYPTILRNVGFGMNLFWGRAGATIAPQVFLLGLKTSTLVPYAIIGTLMMLSAFLVLRLPETRKQVLMDRLVSKEPSVDNEEKQNMVMKDPVMESSL